MVYDGNILKGKTAIVTGARRGIGKGIAINFAKVGADVVVCDNVIEDGKLEEVAKEIRDMKRASLSFKLDVTQKSAVNNMIKKVIAKFRKIDILVNCAGISLPGKSLLECDEPSWNIVIDVNLNGTFLCSQAVAKQMIKQKKGSIINIASDIGIKPIKNVGSYCVSKAGVIMFTQQLSMELGEYKIRVNAIAPGFIPTDINTPLWNSISKQKKVANGILIGRLGSTGDISNAAIFLASDNSSFVTGHTLVVNGGGPIVPPLA